VNLRAVNSKGTKGPAKRLAAVIPRALLIIVLLLSTMKVAFETILIGSLSTLVAADCPAGTYNSSSQSIMLRF
jgi:hypothetical protein